MGNKPRGKEKKEVRSIRLEPAVEKKLLKKFKGTLQEVIDYLVNRYLEKK